MRIASAFVPTIAFLAAVLATACQVPLDGKTAPMPQGSSEPDRYVTTGYSLAWSDEFSTGSAPDSNKWNLDVGTGTNGWGNNELEYYTARPQNVSVANDVLTITSLKESYNGSAYTSARLNTKGKFSFTYGKVVARIMLSSGNRAGIWPAFWMLGANIDTVGWPQCGEIDIMENKGSSTIYSTLHWWDESTSKSASYGQTTTTTITGFHDYEVEWTPTMVYGRVDGVTYFTMAVDTTSNPNVTEFQKPFYLLLNQAVGGTFAGRPSGATVFPSVMSVDYVRVYQKTVP